MFISGLVSFFLKCLGAPRNIIRNFNSSTMLCYGKQVMDETEPNDSPRGRNTLKCNC